MTWIHSLEPFVSWLLQTSWQGSLLALFVLLLQRIFRHRLDARWIYALWGLVLIRLLAPSLPESPSSVYHFTPVPPSPSVWIEPAPPSPLEIQVETMVLPAPSPSLLEVLTICWLAGAAAVALATFFLHLRLHRKLRQTRPVEDPQIIRLLESCAEELGLARPPLAVIFPHLSSPAVIGLWRPWLLLPADLGSRFSSQELRFIFLHEFAHLKRGDLVVQWLLTFLQIFHWFNPVLWFAFTRIRQDREAATDAMVLAQTGETSRRDYGNTLLKLLEQFEHRNSLAGIVGILENKGPIQKRILHISRFTRGAYRWSLLAAVLLAGVALFFLTSPKAETSAKALNQPSSNLPDAKTLFGEKLHNLRLGELKVKNLTLIEVSQILEKKVRDLDSDHIPFSVKVGDSNDASSLRVSIDLKNPSFDEVVRNLSENYGVIEFLKLGEVTLALHGPEETAFRRNAITTLINAKFDSTPLREALLTIQKLAATRGFSFELKGLQTFYADSKVTIDLKNYPVERALRAVAYLGRVGIERETDQFFYQLDPKLFEQSFPLQIETKFFRVPVSQMDPAGLSELEKDFSSSGLESLIHSRGIDMVAAPSVTMYQHNSAKVEVEDFSLEFYPTALGENLNIVATGRLLKGKDGAREIIQEFRGNWDQKDGQQVLIQPALKTTGTTSSYVFAVVTARLIDSSTLQPLLPSKSSYKTTTLGQRPKEFIAAQNIRDKIELRLLGPIRCENLSLLELTRLLEKRIREKVSGPPPISFKVRELNGAADLKITLNQANPNLKKVFSILYDQYGIFAQEHHNIYTVGIVSREEVAFGTKERDTRITTRFDSVPVKKALLSLQKLAAERGFAFQFTDLDKLPDKTISADLDDCRIDKALRIVTFLAGWGLDRGENEFSYSLSPSPSKSFPMVKFENRFLKIPAVGLTSLRLDQIEKDFLKNGPSALQKIPGAGLSASPSTVVLMNATGTLHGPDIDMTITPRSSGENLQISTTVYLGTSQDPTREPNLKATWSQQNGQQIFLRPPLNPKIEKVGFYTIPLLTITLIDPTGTPFLPTRLSYLTASLQSYSALPADVAVPEKIDPAKVQQDFLQAIKSNDLTKVAQYLKEGADPNRTDGNEVPLSHCTSAAMVDLLVGQGARTEAQLQSTTLLESAFANTRNPDVFEALLKHGAPFDPKITGPRLLTESVGITKGLSEKDLIALARFWIAKGVSPNECSDAPFLPMPPLQASTTGDKTELIRFLIQNGADPNLKNIGSGVTPLQWAIMAGDFKSAQTLKELGATGVPDLIWYAALGDTGRVSELLKKGVYPNQTDGIGQTALHMAVRHGHPEVAQLLLEAGANPNQFSSLGYSSHLTLACLEDKYRPDFIKQTFKTSLEDAQQRLEKLRILFSATPLDLDYRDQRGWTALHQAAWGMNQQVVSKILELNGNPNAQDKMGKTPLLLAAESPNCKDLSVRSTTVAKDGSATETQNGSSDIIQSLLKAGAKLDLKTKAGQNQGDLALQAAALAGNGKAANLLIKIIKPTQDASLKKTVPIPSVQIQASLIEICTSKLSPDEMIIYRAQLERGDINSLSGMKGAGLLVAPKVTVPENNQGAMIEIVQDFRLPNQYEKNKGQPMSPVEFETIPVGFQVEVRAHSQDEGTLVSGKLEVRNLDSMITEDTNRGAAFTTKETRFNTLLEEGVPRIVNRFTTAERQTTEKNGQKETELVEKETILILTAKKMPL